MSKTFTRREALTIGFGATAGSVLYPSSSVLGADSALSTNPVEHIVPCPKQVTMDSGPGLSPLLLDRCLASVDDFQPDERIRVSIGEVDAHSPEAYRLDIDASGATIVGASQAGAFYGVQTLAQIVRFALESEAEIPSISILDWPDIAYRAVHFDTKHHLDTLDTYYRAIDRLASLKVNAIIWEFEDKLRYRRRPEIGSDNAISLEEMQALTRYARRRHIEISPLVQGLGHAGFILKHPEFSHLRDDPESDWAFDPMQDQTYEVQFDLYRDAIEATPGSKYLHIGGDEVNVGASQEAQDSGMSPLELHLLWLNKVSVFLVKQGRIPIMWDDMPLKHGEVYRTTHDGSIGKAKSAQVWKAASDTLDGLVEQFPREAVYMRWSYHTPSIPGNQDALDWYAKSDLKVMSATAAQTRWPVYPRRNGNLEPIRTLCRMTATRSIDGILCTSWDDDSPHMAFYWRGWTCFSDFSWHSEGRNEAEALLAYASQSYGKAAAPFAAQGLTSLENAMDIWDTVLITSSRRNVCWPATMEGIIDPPTSANSIIWRADNGERIARAEEGLRLTQTARKALETALQSCDRNRYELELALALVNLQSWSHEVISTAGTTPYPTLENRWKAFLELYNQQRILRNPPGYVLDQNHHTHQAACSNGPEWMIAVELEYNRRLESK